MASYRVRSSIVSFYRVQMEIWKMRPLPKCPLELERSEVNSFQLRRWFGNPSRTILALMKSTAERATLALASFLVSVWEP